MNVDDHRNVIYRFTLKEGEYLESFQTLSFLKCIRIPYVAMTVDLERQQSNEGGSSCVKGSC